MNRIIKEQLSKCVVADIPKFDEKTTHLLIPKRNKQEVELELNHTYIVALAQYIYNPPNGFTLADNWNKGISPKETHLIIKVLDRVGKMIKTRAVGFDFDNNKETENNYKQLWLPSKGITIIKEVK